jgi:hypothetical protein
MLTAYLACQAACQMTYPLVTPHIAHYYGLTIAHDIQENSQAQGKFPSIFMSTILSTDQVGTGGRDTSMNTTTISMLTDNVLLELFDLYRNESVRVTSHKYY